ncbi:MAG: chromosomal replication initiator protein DnaA [Armatimonadota bacterium]|nr:chromosomal replication initiator protein DnaA [Armatimonadota bacterium]
MSDWQLQLGEDEAYRALQSAWEHVLDALSERVNKPSFESWIRTARPIAMDGSLVRLGTPSRFAKHYIETKHLDTIRDLLELELGQPLRVQIELVDATEPVLMVDRLPRKPVQRPPADEDEPLSQPLNKRYTFENFVVGPSNRLAHACAVSVAENPGKTYNPLFIYGGSGLGKTHLMQAIGHHIIESQPDLRVLYVSGETFTYHYITALREHKTAQFRRKYRDVDVWLVDDIHFLVGKERTEEEFFHTYNALYDTGKQIVLTSDRAPKELDLDNRLLSRFECGMIADIKPPDLETRIAIIQSKAASENMTLPYEVMLYIAGLITTNIRQIEGALIKLHAYASLMRAQVTQDLAQEVLGNYFTPPSQAIVDAEKVQKEVARRFNLDVSDLKGPSRTKDVVIARQVAMYLMRQLTDWSLPAIGRAFGGRDHTTVLHACKCIAAKIALDKAFCNLVEDLAKQIRDGRNC